MPSRKVKQSYIFHNCSHNFYRNYFNQHSCCVFDHLYWYHSKISLFFQCQTGKSLNQKGSLYFKINCYYLNDLSSVLNFSEYKLILSILPQIKITNLI